MDDMFVRMGEVLLTAGAASTVAAVAWLCKRAVDSLDNRLGLLGESIDGLRDGFLGETRGIRDDLREHLERMHALDTRVRSIETTHTVRGCDAPDCRVLHPVDTFG